MRRRLSQVTDIEREYYGSSCPGQSLGFREIFKVTAALRRQCAEQRKALRLQRERLEAKNSLALLLDSVEMPINRDGSISEYGARTGWKVDEHSETEEIAKPPTCP